MRKDILKKLSKINDEIVLKTPVYKETEDNIIFTHTNREELILTKKPVYTYEELLVYLHNLDSIWESKIKNKLNCDSYFN